MAFTETARVKGGAPRLGAMNKSAFCLLEQRRWRSSCVERHRRIESSRDSEQNNTKPIPIFRSPCHHGLERRKIGIASLNPFIMSFNCGKYHSPSSSSCHLEHSLLFISSPIYYPEDSFSSTYFVLSINYICHTPNPVSINNGLG